MDEDDTDLDMMRMLLDSASVPFEELERGQMELQSWWRLGTPSDAVRVLVIHNRGAFLASSVPSFESDTRITIVLFGLAGQLITIGSY